MFERALGTLALFLLTASAVSAQQPVIVKKGETLSEIARRELGDGNRWRYLCDLNKNILNDCNVLPVGATLVISDQPAPQEKAAPVIKTAEEKPAELPPERKNLVSSPAEFASDYWSAYFVKPEMSSGQPDPTGGNVATRLNSADAEASGGGATSGILHADTLAAGEYTVGVWVRSTAEPIAVTFGLSDKYQNSQPILVNDKWQYLQQQFVVTEPTDRLFQISERTLNNADWEIFGVSVEAGVADTPFYASAPK